LNPEGAATTYWFEISDDGGVNYSSTLAQGPVGGSSDVAVSTDKAGLAEDTEYRYRLVAQRGNVLARSAPQSFTTTDVEPPAVTLEPVTDLTDSGAELNATIDPNGAPTTYHFEYSPDGGSTWQWLPGPDGDPATNDEHQLGTLLDVPVARSDALFGLNAKTTYPISISATNIGGTTTLTGTLETPAGPPQTSDVSVSQVTSSSARLSAEINPRGTATTYHFQYGTGFQFDTSTPSSTLPAGDGPVAVEALVSGLQPLTAYEVQVVADNGVGTPSTGFGTFGTPAPPPFVTATAVKDVTPTSATVIGHVDGRGQAGSYWATAVAAGGFMKTAKVTALPADGGPLAVSVPLTGLPSGTTFAVRVWASSSGGQRSSEPLQLVTPAASQTAPKDPSGGGVPPYVLPSFARPTNRFAFASTIAGATATIAVAVPGKGVVSAHGGRLSSATKRATAKQVVELKLRLTKRGRRALQRSKSGRLRTSIAVAFKPARGSSRTIRRSVVFRRGR
jgi:hypothetical protein